MTEQIHKVVVIGGGCAGFTAAIYTARALLSPIVITGNLSGGQLMNTSEVENFPGYPEGVQGPNMMCDLQQQAERFGAKIVTEDVCKMDLTVSPFVISTDNGSNFFTHSVIIATGANPVYTNLEGEEQFIGNGISTCSTCDGAFFRDQEVIVVGGGDTAMEDAIFLTRFASKVTIIHRRDEFRASKVMLDRAKNNDKIFFKTFRTVKRWNTDDNGVLNSALLVDPRDPDVEEVIHLDGAFIAIGHKPATSFIPKEVEKDDDGYILHKENTMTSVEGIFACGDVTHTNKFYSQAVTACGEGCKAALDVERWLEQKEL